MGDVDMKLRFTLLVVLVGIAAAYYYRDPYLLLYTAFGFCILYSMRCIEYQIGDLKGRIVARSKENMSLGDAFAVIGKAYAQNPTLEMRDRIRDTFYVSDMKADLEDGVAFREKLEKANAASAIYQGDLR